MSINWAKHIKRLVLTLAIALTIGLPITPPSVKLPPDAPVPQVNWNS